MNQYNDTSLTSGFMISAMKLRDRHHVAEFAVLVTLGAVEHAAVDHANRFFPSILKAFQVSEVSERVDRSTTDSVVIACDRAHDNHSSIFIFGHVID